MATLQLNSIIKGMRGSLGNAVLRQVGNRTILSCKPRVPKKQSEQQRINREKFKVASAFAKNILKDPQKKAYYLQKAKKLKLPNAYTAAVTDYMRKAEIKAVHTEKVKGRVGDAVHIKVFKKGFSVNEVKVEVRHSTGKMIEWGYAIRKEPGEFIYKMCSSIDDMEGVIVRAIVASNTRNEVMKEVCLA